MEKLLKKTNLLLLILILNSLIVSSLEISSVHISPIEINPSDKATIEIRLANNLDQDIKDISIKLNLINNDLPFAPLESGTEKTIEELKENRETLIKFNIIVFPETQPKIYKIPIKISYKDKENKTTELNDVISINIQSEPSIKTTSEETSLIKGLTQDLNINIINNGIPNIKFLTIKLEEQNSFNLLSPNLIYIGNLDSDDTETITLSLFIKDLSTSEAKIPLKISYKDTNNKEYLEEQEIKLKLYTTEEAKALGLIQNKDYSRIIFFIILIFIIILFIIYRKRK